MAIGASAQTSMYKTIKKVLLYQGDSVVYKKNYDKLDSLVFVDVEVLNVPDGTLPGEFSVSADTKVHFSQGNLQYVGEWQFAETQWDIFGSDQYDYHRDLFGWGTGNTPNNISTDYNDYPDSTSIDWGVNPITNGGNADSLWRTLTTEEWNYLFFDRENAATLFALGTVNGEDGVILLPDNWEKPAGASFTPSTTQGLADQGNGTYMDENNGHYIDNTYSIEQWIVMESAGAVFLPAAGIRYSMSAGYDGASFYWSATPVEPGLAFFVYFGSTAIFPEFLFYRYYGSAVRLVR